MVGNFSAFASAKVSGSIGDVCRYPTRVNGPFRPSEPVRQNLVQETLLAAWRGLDGFEEWASLRSWLNRIATNRSSTQFANGDAAQSRRTP